MRTVKFSKITARHYHVYDALDVMLNVYKDYRVVTTSDSDQLSYFTVVGENKTASLNLEVFKSVKTISLYRPHTIYGKGYVYEQGLTNLDYVVENLIDASIYLPTSKDPNDPVVKYLNFKDFMTYNNHNTYYEIILD